MNRAMEWLRITWRVLLIAAAIMVAGLFLMTNGTGVAPLLGLALLLFGAYWAYKGTTPDRSTSADA